MKKSQYTEEQIIGILKHEVGVKTADLCREHGISAATFYAWKSKFGGHGGQRSAAAEGDGRQEPPSEAAGGGAESARRGAEGCDPKKRLEFAGLREEVAFVSVEFRLSERAACKLLGVERSSYRYEPRPDLNIELREELVSKRMVLNGPGRSYGWVSELCIHIALCGYITGSGSCCVGSDTFHGRSSLILLMG